MIEAAFVLAAALTVQAAADSLHYVVLNHGRHAGDMSVVTTADTVAVRYRYVDRGRVPSDVTARYIRRPDGTVVRFERRGSNPAGRPAEDFEVNGSTARWRSEVDSGSAAVDGRAFYRPLVTTPHDDMLLANMLLGRPRNTAPVLPFSTEARALLAADTTLLVAGVPRRLRLVILEGHGDAPSEVWLDEGGALFASGAGWFITIRRGAEPVLPVLRSIELAFHARRSGALARRLTAGRTAPLVIRNGDLFDSERGVVRPRTTIVVEGDRITAVGPADSVRVPAGATVIDATGKTVLPGLWDMHGHIDASGSVGRSELIGLLQLASGITTVRDLAADIDRAVSRRDRADAGTVLSPRILLAGFMEGPGRTAGPTDVLVRTEDEALEWVARYDSLGYRQIKLYNLVHPVLIPTIAAEAKKRGMRLSGHVPIGLSLTDAVRLGFDEIQHVSNLVNHLLPDSFFVYRLRREMQSARLAPFLQSFDVNGPEATALFAFLRDRGTVIDGTFNLDANSGTPLPDGTDPVFGPTLEWLPPLIKRRFAVPPAPPEPAAQRQSREVRTRILKGLFDAGVTLVPGTDNLPLAYHGELEIYERAGIPAPDVLRIATIVPARVMKEDTDYGSIAVGKVADLVIVDGQPATRIRDLRRTELVVRAGRVYRARDLYAAVGLTPKW
jgi:hypothetical protein